MSATINTDGLAATVVGKFLLVILILGILGTMTELILLKHTEDVRQWVPLILMPAGLILLAWHGFSVAPLSIKLFRWLMIAFIISGLAGIYFHFQGGAEFKLEGNPSLRGWALFWEAIYAKTPPLLAPGAMIQLGFIGLVYIYKHPALSRVKL